MKATATIVVKRVGDRNVVVDRRSAAPFSVRPCGERILLASSAAGPVGGDELGLVIDIGRGAHADVGSVAAGMVWPGANGEISSMRTECTVGRGAHLDLRFEPTISVAESHHSTTKVVQLDGDATCCIIDEVALGRSNEKSGCLEQSLRVERNGRSLVHHDEVFGPDVAGALSAVSVGAARFVLTAVVVGVEAGVPGVRVEADKAACWLPIASDAGLFLAIGPNRTKVLGSFAELTPSYQIGTSSK